MHITCRFLSAVLFAIFINQAAVPVKKRPAPASPANHSNLVSVSADYGRLPLAFEPNMGQTDARVRFLARGGGMTAFFTETETDMVLSRGRPSKTPYGPGPREALAGDVEQTVVRMKLAGAAAPRRVTGMDKLPGISNYFIGNDPAKWHTDVPHYGRIQYEEVYPGIDLVWYGNQRQLEYDFVVAPRANPKQIQVAYEGVESLRVEADGDLVLRTALGEMRQQKPKVYQEIAGQRVEVRAQYSIVARNRVSFALAKYDRKRELRIDPVALVYSTYLGGVSATFGDGIAVDSSGNAYVTGYTTSTDFPTLNPLQPSNAGGSGDVFVTKFNRAGSALFYSTYLGGSGQDRGNGIAVDSSGSAYVTGYTASTNFPTMNPLQPAYGGGQYNAFVAKLSPAGSALVYSTYLGGSGLDQGYGIAVDSSGNASVTGFTNSSNFPTMSPLQPAYGGGGYDAFVAKVNPTGSALLYSTYLGGSGTDEGYGIAVDSSGSAYVTGFTASTNFPTMNPLQPAYGGGQYDAFVAKLNPAGSALVYSTYLGGSANDEGAGIAVDSSGSAYVTGLTASTNFPTVNPLQPAYGGGEDAFVAKLNPAGSALVYSTWLGGSGQDQGTAIAVDGAGSAYVTGSTASTNFPTQLPYQPTYLGGSFNAFVSKLTTAGNELVYSTYLGGNTIDQGAGIAVDGFGSAYVTGLTGSANFPTASPFQPTLQGGYNAFISKLGFPAMMKTQGDNQSTIVGTAFAQVLQVSVSDGNGNASPNVAVTFTAPSVGASGTFYDGVTTMVTNPFGVVTALPFTANATAGAYQVIASASGSGAAQYVNPVAFSLTNYVPGVPASITPTGGTPQGAGGNIGFSWPLLATVTDSFGNPVPGAPVTFTPPASGASAILSEPHTVPTDSFGVATIWPTSNGIPGSYTVTASVLGVSTPALFLLTNTMGTLAISGGNNQTAALGAAFGANLQVTLTNGGNPVSGATVTFTANTASDGASGTFAGAQSVQAVTNASGVASAALTANNYAGKFTVTPTQGAPGPVFTLINGSATSILLGTPSPNPSVLSQPVTLTANVTPSSATGNVTFYDGTKILGVSTLSGGTATLTTPFLPSSNNALTARHDGSAQNVPGVMSTVQNATVTTYASPSLGTPVLYEMGRPSVNNIGSTIVQVVTADFNGDGIADLLTINQTLTPLSPNTFAVLLGNGDGTFASSAPAAPSSSECTVPASAVTCVVGGTPIRVAVGDFNGDGKPDIAIADSAGVSVFLGNGDGTFQASATYTVPNATAVAVADFNGDGIADLAVATASPIGGVEVLLGNGDGTFQPPLGPYPATIPDSLTVGDFNNDGIPDVATTTGGGDGLYYVLLGNGDGSLQTGVSYSACGPFGITSGHFTASANLDLVGLSGGDRLCVAQGNGDGTFTLLPQAIIETGGSSDLAVGDFNGDGIPDLAVDDANLGNIDLLLGNGDGTFRSVALYTFSGGAVEAASIVVGDFNRDGRADVAVVYGDTNIAVLLGTISSETMTKTQGDNQSTILGAAFSQNLQGTITDSSSNPVPNVTVTFTAPSTGASGTFAGGVNTAVTNSSGVATAATFTANSTAGGYQVTASATGVNSVAFSLTNTASPSIIPTGGTPQSATIDAPFAMPLQATVLDSGSNPISGVKVTFAAPTSGASANLSSSTASTNSSGVASVTATANSTAGGPYSVTASAAGVATQATFSLTNTPSAGPPSAVSVSPSSGSGTSQPFTFVATDPNGAAYLNDVYMLLNPKVVTTNACEVRYYAPTGLLYLLSDNGGSWGAGAKPGGTAAPSNSQCTLNASTSTVTPSGNTLTVVLNLTFTPSFDGGKQIWLYASDRAGQHTGWIDVGTWMVGIAEQPPSTGTVSPSSGFGTTQQFTFTASDPNGAGDLLHVYMLLNEVLSAQNGCEVNYYASTGLLYLLSDNGSTWGSGGQPGVSGTLSNSQCTVSLGTSTVTPGGNTLTVVLDLSFSASFDGGKQIWEYAQDWFGEHAGWNDVGTWMVGGSAEAGPSVGTVSPSSEFGTAQTFTFTASDPNGAGDLSHVYMLWNSVLSARDGCEVNYYAATGLLYLLSDDGSTWGTGAQPGVAGTLTNSQCTVNLGSSTVTPGGNTLTVLVSLSFSGGFDGGKQIWEYAQDWLGEHAGWTGVGTWMVDSIAEAPPSVGALTAPAGGSGTGGQFQFGFSDPNGSGDIASALMLFNTKLSTVKGCEVYYVASQGLLYLLSDSGNGGGWVGSVPQGGSGTVQNSQCTLSGTGSTVSGSGNNLTITLNLTFAGGFAGSQQIWGYVQDWFGEHDGWTEMGAWTVP